MAYQRFNSAMNQVGVLQGNFTAPMGKEKRQATNTKPSSGKPGQRKPMMNICNTCGYMEEFDCHSGHQCEEVLKFHISKLHREKLEHGVLTNQLK